MTSILTTSLKKHVMNRILLDMIQDTKNLAGPDSIIILVLDNYTAKMITTFLTMTDILNNGIISVEKLERVRERFPIYHAIYFISPCEESIQHVIKNFEDPLKPQYGRIHLFFTQRILNSTMDKLCINETFIKRVLSCKEVNISFLIRDDNLFDLGMSTALEIFTVKYKDELKGKIQNNILDRLFTVVASLKDMPYIQFQKNSIFSEEIAKKLSAQLNEFYSDNKRSHNEKRGNLLILDRSVDVSTPLLHDYFYECMVYEIMEVKDNVLRFNNAEHKFDEHDHLWKRHKAKHLAEVLGDVQKEFKIFMENDISKVQSGKETLDNFEKMSGVMQNMKNYKEQSKNFGTHIRMGEKLTEDYRSLHIDELIEFEQEVVSGVSKDGEELTTKEILNDFAKLIGKLKEDDIIRLLMVIHSNIDINEKDFKNICKDLEEYKLKAIYNLSWFGINFNSEKKSVRRTPIITKKEIELKIKNKTSTFKITRATPVIEKLVTQCSDFELNENDFPFIDKPTKIPVKKNNFGLKTNLFGADEGEEDELPYLIVFVIGGIAHNEICALENLNNLRKIKHKLVIGSTSIINGNDYIKEIKNLRSPSDSSKVNEVDLKSIELKFI